MACGDKVEIEVTSWEWCRKLFFVPWRCKKTKVKTRYYYEFKPSRARFGLLKKKYQGCCGGKLYEWSEGFAIFGTGNGPWNEYSTLKRTLSSPAAVKGDCPFNEGWEGPVID